jgi:trehalose-phosphatase
MLDYDGTLAPFRVARGEARPLPRAMELLRRILAGTRTSVAIVSGRPVNEVERLVGPLPALLVGEHGWERRLPGGRVVRRPLPAPASRALDRAERLAREAGWGGRLERKRSGVVLHTRGLPAAAARALERRCALAWRPLARGGAVRVEGIHGGMEVRARGWDKGAVVRALCSRGAPGTLGVFVGDDLTDEDAFAAVRDWGFGVRVGGDGRPTSAMGRVDSCAALPDFLRRWLAEAAPARRPGARAAGPAGGAGRREHRKRVTRRDLIAAGRRLFGARGLYEPRIEDLSRHAGIAKGTLYGYFANREELIEAVIAAGLDELLAAVRRRTAGARGRAALVGRAADAHLAFFAAHADLMRILHQARGLQQFDRPESPWLRRLLAGYVERLAAVLGGGAATGPAARRERAAAKLLFGAVSGVASVRVGPAGAPPRDARSPATRRALVALVLAFEGRRRR